MNHRDTGPHQNENQGRDLDICILAGISADSHEFVNVGKTELENHSIYFTGLSELSGTNGERV